MPTSTEQYASSGTNTSSNGEPSKSLTEEEKKNKKSQYQTAATVWDSAKCIKEGCTIEGEKYWWGFKLKLNHRAAELYTNMLGFVQDHLPKCFGPEVKEAIAFALLLKEHRITKADEASDYQGCSFVSPWVLPFALTVVRNTSGDDQHLWSTVWDPGQNGWGEQTEFTGPDVLSEGGPALAQHGDLLYCVHRGGSDDTALYWAAYSTDNGWCDDENFPGQLSATTPSLVEFQGKLYCFYQGASNSCLYFCNLNADGNSWENNTHVMINGHDLDCVNGCGVAVYNNGDTNQLHLVYQDNTGGNHIKHLWTTDLKAWNSVTLDQRWTTKDTPALVAYDNGLLMVNRGGGDECLYYCFYNGANWIGDEQTIPGEKDKTKAFSSHGVGLAVFDNKVFMVHRSNENNGELWYSTYTSSSGWAYEKRIAGQSTGETPALACYKDPQVKPENYDKTDESYSEGVIASRLICVHRGWGKY